MPRVFNPLSFFRLVPNRLLERFFAEYAAFDGFDWEALVENRVEPILERCHDLSSSQRAEVFQVFRHVHSLATSLGTQVLIETARDLNLEVAQMMAGMQNVHERALWCYLKDRRLFTSARTLAYIENLSKRSWLRLKHLPPQPIEVTSRVLAELRRQLSEYFWSTQFRGEDCAVEHRPREGGIDAFFAYLSDYAGVSIEYDAGGTLECQRRRPVFEVAFTYDRRDGTTDIYARGTSKLRKDLAAIFARVVLSAEVLPMPPREPTFNLQIFKDPNLSFPTDPADGISSVRVIALRVLLGGRRRGLAVFRIDARSQDETVYDLMADRLAERHALLSDCTIQSVTLHAFLRCQNGHQRSLRFTIASPAFCDLAFSREELMLRRYLREWKIEFNPSDVATAA